MSFILRILVSMGYKVTFAASHEGAQSYEAHLRVLGAEPIKFGELVLNDRLCRFGAVILSRKSNFAQHFDEIREACPSIFVIYDTGM